MRTASASAAFHGSVPEAETHWYDTRRWQGWVDGLAEVVSVHGQWPLAGSSVTWESFPAGRGTVTELVVGYEPLVGQTNEVEDDSIRGRQTVAFTPLDGEVEVTLSLEYELKKRSIFTPLVDILFIRRAMETSLRTTLTKFGAELRAGAGREAPPGERP